MRSFRVWDEVVSPLNLWRAWEDFARGKRRRCRVAAFAIEADRHVHQLARELQAGRWWPGSLRLLFIRDPKRRVVSAAPVRDRVVHHAIHRVVAPLLNRAFIDQSYACLPGRGSHRACLRFLGELRRWRFVLPLDIARYFYSIDRRRLRALLCRKLPEARLQTLLDRILASGEGLYQRAEVVSWLGWDGPAGRDRGLPIGNLTSQWWGNLYLDGLDHHAKRRLKVPSYQRYLDDMTLFGNDRRALIETREAVAHWLEHERGLTLKHPRAMPRRCDRTHLYLGYRISRRGIAPGPRMIQRLPALVRAKTGEPDKLRACTAAVSASWMFGV